MSVYIPKPVVVGLSYLTAGAVGWLLYATASGVANADASTLTGSLSSAPAATAPAPPTTVPVLASAVEPSAAPSSSAGTATTGTAPAVTGSTPAPAPSTGDGGDETTGVVSTVPSETIQPTPLSGDPTLAAALADPLASIELTTAAIDLAPEVSELLIRGPGNYLAPILAPLPGAQTRAVAIAEWESYRTDIAGRNIVVATDDSNLFMNRDGKLNGNTGDTDASGLNVTDARNSIIRGTESADAPPWGGSGSDDDEEEEEEDDDEDTDTGDDLTIGSTARVSTSGAIAAVTTNDAQSLLESNSEFPFTAWLRQISGDTASAIHTDEGTTLASGQDAIVIGGDGYDDDDNRAVGENLVLTRDDCNVVIGGSGAVNAQIGDSEQGAVIMDVDNVLIEGGGAY